jgi:drug/metabolite transporter (DMT)-like permease
MTLLVIKFKERRVMHQEEQACGIDKANFSIHMELLFVVTIWAGTFVATKIVLEELTPGISALYRYLIASAIILIIDFRNTERIQKRDYPIILLLSTTGVTLYYLLQHYGIRYTAATDAAILISLSPVFIGIISWALLGEKLKATSMYGLTVSFIGCLLIITEGGWSLSSSSEKLWGNILILLTAIVWALYSVYGKKLLKVYSPRIIIKYTTVIGTVLLIPVSFADTNISTNYIPSGLCVLNLLYLGGAASVYGYIAWYRGLGRLPAVTVGSYLYFRPLLTGLIAAVILKEQINYSTIFGGVMVIVGTYLTTR